MKWITFFYARLACGTGVECEDRQTRVKDEKKCSVTGWHVEKEHGCRAIW